MKFRLKGLFICICFCLCLTGCNPEARHTEYEIINANGDRITYRDKEPSQYIVGSTPYNLEILKKEGTRFLGFLLRKQDGAIVYQYEEARDDIWHGRIRGESESENTLYVYYENWRTHHMDGYLDGALDDTKIMEINMQTGEVICQQTAGRNEFILTIQDRNVYIYKLGRIYIRPLDDWNKKQQLHDFKFRRLKSYKMWAIIFKMSETDISVLCEPNSGDTSILLAKIPYVKDVDQ